MEFGVKIAENDPVRKLVEICEELDYTKLYETYVRTWRKVSPETLFELVVFGYMQRRFSTRQIEEACRTDISGLCGFCRESRYRITVRSIVF